MLTRLIHSAQRVLEKDVFPDALIRFGIRRLLSQGLAEHRAAAQPSREAYVRRFADGLKESPIAVDTRAANEQHYEVPTEFFQLVLGRYLKYSCGYWIDGKAPGGLDQAERDMMETYVAKAELSDGHEVLELGCGWGSFSLFVAENFPRCRVTAVSNSRTQKHYIDGQIARRQLRNIQVITADMNTFWTDRTFDRVVSIEMFEHMRNYQKLLKNIACWLEPRGKLFVHIFTHKTFPYFYKADDADWLGKYFFTGGLMPSNDLLHYFQDDLVLEKEWEIDGRHYQKTAEAWLRNMDRHRPRVEEIFNDTYGAEAKKWRVYWRVFLMACAELWGYRAGSEWMVCHYLFGKRPS